MKFFGCSRCLSAEQNQVKRSEPVQDITNPLVVTKRLAPKVLNPRRNEEEETPSICGRKNKFPGLLSGALSSWPVRLRRKKKPEKHSAPLAQCSRKTMRVIEPALKRRLSYRAAPTKTQRLIRMYEEKANSYSPQTIGCSKESYAQINPGSLERHQNFKNKFNTLDFKRMNTVALQEPSPSSMKRIKSLDCKNNYKCVKANPLSTAKFVKKTMLEDILKERIKIEQTMIDLLNGQDPGTLILKRNNGNDEKKVRFKEDNAKDELEKRCLVISDENNALERKLNVDDGTLDDETEIKLNIDHNSKIEDFYVEKTTTYLQNKTIEDKALIVKICPKDEEIDVEQIGNTRDMEIVFRNFGKINL